MLTIEQVPETALPPAELPHPSGSIDEELDQLTDPAGLPEECPVTTFSRVPCCF
jgi:hypothetical protein